MHYRNLAAGTDPAESKRNTALWPMERAMAGKKNAASKHNRVPIRIVPMHPAKAAAAAPQLTYRGGPLLTNVEVFTLFWGDGWQSTSARGLISQVNQFFSSL